MRQAPACSLRGQKRGPVTASPEIALGAVVPEAPVALLRAASITGSATSSALKKSLRGGFIKRSGLTEDEEDDGGRMLPKAILGNASGNHDSPSARKSRTGSLGLAMAGSVAVAIRRSMRGDSCSSAADSQGRASENSSRGDAFVTTYDSQLEAIPSKSSSGSKFLWPGQRFQEAKAGQETHVPRPPPGQGRGSRPGPQATAPEDPEERPAGFTATPPASASNRASSRSGTGRASPSQFLRGIAPAGWASAPIPSLLRTAEDSVAVISGTADDSLRKQPSSFTGRSSLKRNSTRAKSTPSRGKHHRPIPVSVSMAPASQGGDAHGQAGVIDTAVMQSFRNMWHRLGPQRRPTAAAPGESSPLEGEETERESFQSRRTGTFTSGRGTFTDGGDEEASVHDTIGDY